MEGLELTQLLGQLGVFLISRTVGARVAARQVAHVVLLAEWAVVLPRGPGVGLGLGFGRIVVSEIEALSILCSRF